MQKQSIRYIDFSETCGCISQNKIVVIQAAQFKFDKVKNNKSESEVSSCRHGG